MTTKEQMLERIYEEMADNEDTRCSYCRQVWNSGCSSCGDIKPVLIGDVFDYMEVERTLVPFKTELTLAWWKKREPIDSQSEECISYVFSLIK